MVVEVSRRESIENRCAQSWAAFSRILPHVYSTTSKCSFASPPYTRLRGGDKAVDQAPYARRGESGANPIG